MVVTKRWEGNSMTNDPVVWLEGLNEQLRAAEGPKMPQPMTPQETLVKDRLKAEPPPPDALITYHAEPMLTRGCVGGIVGAGGTGKTMFLIQLSAMMTSGGNIGPLRAPTPLRVLLLVGEDPNEELDRRLWRICQGDFPENLYAASIAGLVGPWMELENGNPARSQWYKWMRETITNHKGLDVLIIDPKSRFYGLDENNNDHNTQWIACLESLALEFNLTVLFAHHVSKALGGDLHQNMSRGGSSLADGVRWLVGITSMDKKTAEEYGLNPRDYVEMDLVKANYVAKLPNTLFFKRDRLGALHYTNIKQRRTEEMAQELANILTQNGYDQLTRRDLVKSGVGKNISEDMKKSGFSRSSRRIRDALALTPT